MNIKTLNDLQNLSKLTPFQLKHLRIVASGRKIDGRMAKLLEKDGLVEKKDKKYQLSTKGKLAFILCQQNPKNPSPSKNSR